MGQEGSGIGVGRIVGHYGNLCFINGTLKQEASTIWVYYLFGTMEGDIFTEGYEY